MAEIGVHTILILVISLTTCLEGTKLLANFKKCADLECETLISRVLAMRDYRGPDCLYLNFTKGEEISVYVKLAGEREDLWAGSKGKDFGYFPRDAVQIEEVFIPEEIQIPTKESDFLCLLGVSYAFENEYSELNNDDGENIYLYEEDKDQTSSVYENDFQRESGFYSASESTWYEDQFPPTETTDDIRKTSDSRNWEGVEAASMKQDPIPEVDYVLPFSAVPEVKGWFGFGGEQAEEIAFESVIEQESSIQSRKIAVEAENDLEELNHGEPQTEHKQEPESELSSVPNKQSRVSESKDILNSQNTGWFGSGFTSYLGFGGEDTEPELLSQESNPPLQDVPNSISAEEEPTILCTEISEKDDTVTDNSSITESSWFDFGFSMLGFANANEEKIITYNEKNEEGGEGDKHEHPPTPTSEFDPDKEQEMKVIQIMETEAQLGKEDVLKKTDVSDILPYFKNSLYNFDDPWNFEKETEFPVPKNILDEDNVFENDETEDFSFENDHTANTKVMMLKSRYTQSEDASEGHVLKFLFQIDVCHLMNLAFSPIVFLTEVNSSFIYGINYGNFLALVQQVIPDSICSESNSYITVQRRKMFDFSSKGLDLIDCGIACLMKWK